MGSCHLPGPGLARRGSGGSPGALPSTSAPPPQVCGPVREKRRAGDAAPRPGPPQVNGDLQGCHRSVFRLLTAQRAGAGVDGAWL